MRYCFAALSAIGLYLSFVSAAQAQPAIEAYGELPEIRAFDASPDGSRFAFYRRQGEQELMLVYDVQEGNIGAADVTNVKPRGLNFISNKHVVIFASQTTNRWGGYESGQATNFNIEAGEVTPLMSDRQQFAFAPASAGGNMTPTDDPDVVYYTAVTGLKGRPGLTSISLLRGDLAQRRASIIAKGGVHAIDWSIAKDGTVMAREDFDDAGKVYSIHTHKDGTWRKIYEEVAELPTVSLIGYLPDESGLLVYREFTKFNSVTIHKLSFDGTFSEPLYDSENSTVDAVYLDSWDQMIGIRYAGMKPSYFFFDDGLNQIMASIAANFPSDAVHLIDWTDDYSKLVISISGGKTAPAYFLFDRAAGGFGKVAPQYLQIEDKDIAPVTMINYKARDGLTIPSLLTHPRGAAPGSKLPLIVMPHGGPEAHSTLGFSYRAQYFASRGYLVLQPNFRGSTGFGSAHRDAGHGEWGGKMQDDLTDGVKHLIANGWADPERVCIVGASYGGYAALAGGAFTPDLYKCVAAIAPVTDVPSMMDRIVRYEGGRSSSLAYWKDWLGDRRENRDFMSSISPVNSASTFRAPVLLMHGTDDTVVPYNQSTKMRDALQAAGKNVKFVQLKGEDHWMSSSETRLQALVELDKFISESIGPGRSPAAPSVNDLAAHPLQDAPLSLLLIC